MKTSKIALIATLVSTSSLLAQPNGPMPFSSFDTNNDGIITRYEFSYVKKERMLKKEQDQAMAWEKGWEITLKMANKIREEEISSSL